ncbi:MAG: peptidylprolyl isomerase [Prevotellaceae bacterium]|jgi:peptidyl-prolyl cis-trans isomerase SurA|nr:peptidylprolyl isomerase [Prevotellaceae bacterium]
MSKYVTLKMLLLSGLIALTSTLYAQDNLIDGIAWVVGDEAIMKSEIESVRSQYQIEGKRINGDPRCVIPEELAVQKLYLHQADLDSVIPTDQQVVQQADALINYYISSLGSREKLEEYMNKTYSQIREEARESARTQLAVQQMQEKLVEKVTVTPADVRRYFSKLPADSIPFVPAQVEVQIITAEPKIPVEEIEDIKRRLREFSDRVNNKETDFGTLARMYSEDRATAVNGGETGFFGRGQWVPEFANVAFNLSDPNRVSKIVETEYGFHIIKLVEKRGDRVNVQHILLRPKASTEELQAGLSRLDSIANDIRSEKFTFDAAAAALSADKQTRNNHGLMQNQNTGTSRFEMAELPQEIARVVDRLNIGEISQAFTMINGTDGKEMCAIIKVKNKIPGHKATISDDYQRLKDIVLQHRQMEVLKKWVENKVKQTYVRINEGWDDCNFSHTGWIK